MAADIYSIPVKRIDGAPAALADYKGKVALVVNVASKCGLTPQYDGLEKLYETYRDKGFTVLGFPANEFAGQEPGTNAEIQEFCRSTYSVQFPMFEKIVVKGAGQHPLYQHLTAAKPSAKEKPGGTLKARLAERGRVQEKPNDVLWNFEKFLVGRDGKVVERFAPDVTPDDPMITSAIQAELAKN
jgi:glutathione peroxidase